MCVVEEQYRAVNTFVRCFGPISLERLSGLDFLSHLHQILAQREFWLLKKNKVLKNVLENSY